MNFGNIQKAITRYGKPKHEVAVECGMTRQTLSAILRGTDTLVSRIEKLAKVLDVPVGYFFDETSADGAKRAVPSELEVEVEHLKDLIEQKDKLLEEKERLIQILMKLIPE
jgi:transcriptional regulator with XRE-family HTH domain